MITDFNWLQLITNNIDCNQSNLFTHTKTNAHGLYMLQAIKQFVQSTDGAAAVSNHDA